MELYFWTFVVAIIIFGLGAGVFILDGIKKVENPEIIKNVNINYIVVVFALIFESVAWYIAFKEFRSRQYSNGTPKRGFFQTVRDSKDPTVFIVLFEDSAAMLGLVVAFIGIWLAEYLDMPFLDGVASIIIGIILADTAALLAYESKGLLVGEGSSDRGGFSDSWNC